MTRPMNKDMKHAVAQRVLNIMEKLLTLAKPPEKMVGSDCDNLSF
jgi:hypothetical protein